MEVKRKRKMHVGQVKKSVTGKRVKKLEAKGKRQKKVRRRRGIGRGSDGKEK